MKKTRGIVSPLIFATIFGGMANAEVNDTDGVRTGNSNTIGTNQKSGAFGTDNSASASSLAVGDDNVANGGGIAAGARNNIDLTSYSFALGSDNLLEHQTDSFAIGQLNEMIFPMGYQGGHNFLIGVGNSVDASAPGADEVILNTVLIGAGNTCSKSICWVLGAGNLGEPMAVTLGMYAPSVPGASLILGNGTGSLDRSVALCTMKNGLTLLTNKTWDPFEPLEDPDEGDSTDADGVALEVDGHAVFNGAVIISEPQGDISMGNYQ